jgi:hypothetical protein
LKQYFDSSSDGIQDISIGMQFSRLLTVILIQNPAVMTIRAIIWRRKDRSMEKMRLYMRRIDSFVVDTVVKYRMAEKKLSLV